METVAARYPKLSRQAFQHPHDLKALETLRGFKGLDVICHKIIEFGFERAMFVLSIGSDVRVTPRQFPRVHALVEEACEQLDIALPPVFVRESPILNAVTLGVERPFVILNSRLIQTLTEPELKVVIAHELGHIKCGHVLYSTVAQFLAVAAEGIANATLGLGGLVSLGLQVALANWYRMAELSCDRAALLAVQDPQLCITTLMKLSGTAALADGEADTEEFLAQAAEYDAMDSDGLNKLYKILLTVGTTHPYTAVRAREVRDWAGTDEYRRILAGDYERRAAEEAEQPNEWVRKLEEAGQAASPAAASTLKAAEEAAAAAGTVAADSLKVVQEVVGRAGGLAIDALAGGFKAVFDAVKTNQTPDPVPAEGLGQPGTGAAVSPVSPDFAPCPTCAEPIRLAAIKCRFCGEKIDREFSDGDGQSGDAPKTLG